jgi:hypothetical protein
MATFQARIKSEYRHLYQEFSPDTWYDVEPLWPGTSLRRLDMADKRVAREYLDFREKETAVEDPGEDPGEE